MKVITNTQSQLVEIHFPDAEKTVTQYKILVKTIPPLIQSLIPGSIHTVMSTITTTINRTVMIGEESC